LAALGTETGATARSRVRLRGALVTALWIAPLCLALALGCRSSRKSGSVPSASASTQVLPPLAASSWLAPLDVPGFGEARVALPLGASKARPIVAVIHGDDDRPEWPCGSYHHAGNARSFVLCLRGVPRDNGRFGLADTAATRAELRAALPRLKARYGDHVSKGSIVLAATGPGVERAIGLALEEPKFFASLVLVDGSLESFTSGVIQRYAQAGGKRVLLVCTPDSPCRADGVDRMLALKRAGLDVHLLSPAHGFGLDGEATAMIRAEWAWLVGGDARWH
jgi:hypothetical protein